MTAQDFVPDVWRWLALLLHQVDQGMTICAVQSENVLVARHRHLGHVLAQLDARFAVDFDELVDTAESWLPLACHWNREEIQQWKQKRDRRLCSPKCVPIPKQSILCPCSFKLRIVSSLISFDATMVSELNHGILKRSAISSKVSRAKHDK